jgi:hypothetical protein
MSSSNLSQVMTIMNNEISSIIERNLTPHFETIQIIETLLKQMPEFKRLEQENADLKRRLLQFNKSFDNKVEMVQTQVVQTVPTRPAPVPESAPVPVSAPAPINVIKLEIIEPNSTSKTVLVDELYKSVDLHLTDENNRLESDDEAEETEAEEAEETEEEAEETEEEAEETEEEAEETEEEDGVEGAEPFEEDGIEEAEEADDDGVEGAEPLEEPLEEDGVEGVEPLEEPLEVFMIEIKGKGKFYTNSETNGDIYQIEGEDDVGDQIGKFVNKVATFF